MRRFCSINAYIIRGDLVYEVAFVEDFEKMIGEIVLINSEECKVVDIQRNRCCGFGQYDGDDEKWRTRNLYLKVERVMD